jgi:hypothetical protein
LLLYFQSGNPSTLVDAFGLGVKTPNLLCYECGRVVDRRLVSQTNVLFDNISGDDEQKQHAHSLIRRPSRLSTDGALVAPDSAAAVFSLPVNTDSTLMPSLSIESNHATQNTTGPSQPNGHLSIPTLETISEAAEFAYEIAIDHNDQLPASELIPSPVISSIAPLASTADTNSDVLPVVAEEAVEQSSIAPLVPETPDEHRHRTDPMLAEPDVWIGPAVVSTTGAVWVSLQPQSTSNFANRSPLPGSHHTDSNDLRVSPLPVMSPTQLRASLEVPHTARPANIDEDEVMEKLDRLRQEQERLELLLAQSKAKKQQRQHDSIKSTPSLKSPDIRSPKVDAPSSARKPRPASASTRSNAASTVTPKPRSTPLRPASSSSSRHSPAQSTTPTLIQTHSLPDQHLDMLALSPYAEKRFGLYLPRSRNSTLQGSTRISVSHSQHPAFQQHDLLLQQQQHQLLSSPIHLTSPLSDSPSTFAQSMTSTVTSPSPNLSQFQHLELAMALALASPWKHPGFAAFQ